MRGATIALYAAALCGASFGLAAGLVTSRAAVVMMTAAALLHLSITLGPPVGRLGRGCLLTVAFLAAAALLVSPPPWSDDVYRYLLDGESGLRGLNPYAYAPASPKIADLLEAAGGAPVNHAHLPTIYPPVAQGLFTANAALGGGVFGWKLLMVAMAVGAAALVRRSGWRTPGLPAWLALIGHPLVLVTAAGNGNVDTVALPLSVLWLLAASARRWPTSGLALGIAASIKIFPLGLAAAHLGSARVRRSVVVLAVAAGVLLATYTPVLGLGSKSLGSLGTYAGSWRYNSGPEAVVGAATDRVLASVGVPDVVELEPLTRWNARTGRVRRLDGEDHHEAWVTRTQLAGASTRAVALLALLVVGWTIHRRRWPAARSATVLLLALFLTSPVVHPWYLVWLLVPALRAGSPVGLAWGASVMLAFWGPASMSDAGRWADPLWVRVLEYAAPCLAIVLGFRGRQASPLV